VDDRLLRLKQTAFLSIRHGASSAWSVLVDSLGPWVRRPQRGPAPAPWIPTQQTFRWFFVGGLVRRGGCLFGTTALLLVRGSFSGADDGIRTRDPHLGKVPEPGSLTCGDVTIWPVSSVISFACNGVVS
jgi:hypothetical protein